MIQPQSSLQFFKGIALFTPGGDLIYCIDPTKQERWHLHLCAGLQEILDLPEPPHFLVPCYTAAIDRWLDPRTQQVQTFAEAYPLVLRHQVLLNAVFATEELVWQTAPWSEELCDPIMLATYRSLFPQLWENHDLIVRFEQSSASVHSSSISLARANTALTLQLKLTQPPESLIGNGNQEGKQHFLPNQETKAGNGISFPGRQSGNQLLGEGKPKPATVNEQQPTNSSLLLQPEPLGYVLRLFVAGHSANTERILQNLHHLLEQFLRQPYTLKVIDVFKHPEQAEVDQVSATPTLVKAWPQPVRRLVGDLDNGDKILQMLASPEV